ncbi:MAG: M50 family metallopeptidase [Myxococcaceae bacterium]
MRYLAAIVALGLLVAFHEFGHLLLARLFRIDVRKFAIGFGPAIFSFKGRNIEWVLGAIPFGGYVQIRGMNPHEEPEELNAPGSFAKAAAWKRALILAGGSTANYLLGVAIMFVLLVSGTHIPVPMTIGIVGPGTEAARAQLKPGDEIVAIDGVSATSWSSFVEKVNESPNQLLTFRVKRESEALDLQIKPRPDEKGIGRLGVTQQYVFKRLPPGEAFLRAFGHVHLVMAESVHLLYRLVSLRGGVELGSPVMIVKQTSDAAIEGVDMFLRAVVSITAALALFNLLPVPALDGGRLLFVAIEAATGRPVNQKFETLLHTMGFVALIGLLLVVATGDVMKLVKGPPKEQIGVVADGGNPDGG